MKPFSLLMLIATAGLAFVLLRRRNQQLRADAELWAQATDQID